MALCALRDGMTVPETARQVRLKTGGTVDVAGYVRSLSALGFVDSVDGWAVDAALPAPPSLPWITQRHVRWTLHPVAHAAVAAVVLLGVAAWILFPDGVHLSWHSFVWSSSGTLVLLFQARVPWTLILVHELAHLCTARAYGVPGRTGFGTRLRFLAAQTDVSGIWAAPQDPSHGPPRRFRH
jgi:hypothetical protein